MDLAIKDVAELLNVTEEKIEGWIKQGAIPSYTIDNEWRFSRTEVEDWVLSGSSVLQQDDAFSLPGSHWQQYSLYRAIHKGTLLKGDFGSSKEEIIRGVMSEVAESLSFDPEGVSELLLDRESLMPTSLGEGIAVPHTRDFLLKDPLDAVVTVFPTSPVEWGSLDNKPVHTLFFLFASDDKRHLQILAKLAHLASSSQSLEFLKTHPEKKELLSYVKTWEGGVSAS